MNLLSHRFSQNVSQNFCPVVWQVQGRNPYNIWFIFWEERWLLKFNLKFTDLYARTSLGYGQITSPNLILWIILLGWTPGALFWCIVLTLTFYNLKSNQNPKNLSNEWSNFSPPHNERPILNVLAISKVVLVLALRLANLSFWNLNYKLILCRIKKYFSIRYFGYLSSCLKTA